VSLQQIVGLLKQTIGLDAETVGAATVRRAIDARATARKCENLTQYWSLLRAAPDELQALVELVVVPETWFFRDREAFAALGTIAREQWLLRPAQERLRVLSVPCSTGEEPYTIAMALLETGLPAERFRIDAVDVSARALARAKLGHYGRNSFRGANLAFRDTYFRGLQQGYELQPRVRRQVDFRQANLLEPGFLSGEKPFDVIFCRNLLIYFDRATQEKAVSALGRVLAPNGYIFIGPSETGLLLDLNFVSAKLPMAFAFQRPNPAAKPPGIRPVVGRPAARTERRPAAPPAARPPAPVKKSPPPPPVTPPSVTNGKFEVNLERARKLADEGKLAEAGEICLQFLDEHGSSGEAFYLLGLVHDASGKAELAQDHYQKAVYLEPDHYEALVQLSFLAQRQGDDAGARVLQNRARRVKERSPR